MISIIGNGRAEIRIGGISYGEFTIGRDNSPMTAISNLRDTLGQIAAWSHPKMNFLLGEGDDRKGLAILGDCLCVIEKNGSGINTKQIDYTSLGLAEGDKVEEAVFAVSTETYLRLNADIDKWTDTFYPEKEAKRLRNEYQLKLLNNLLGLSEDCRKTRKKFRIPAEDRAFKEQEQELALLKRFASKEAEVLATN